MKLHHAGFIPLMDTHSFYQLISLDRLIIKIAISLFLASSSHVNQSQISITKITMNIESHQQGKRSQYFTSLSCLLQKKKKAVFLLLRCSRVDYQLI